ncbi:hypothetical protein ACQKWADRAFT_327855 [Trichoderma austrokoningii]
MSDLDIASYWRLAYAFFGEKEHGRCQSQFKLLQLPHDILDKTIDLLEDDKKSLAALALVNTDCLYLARARQFKEIHFDYSPQSHELLRHMATKYLDDKNKPKLSSLIGVCVRKVTFVPLRKFMAETHPELWDVDDSPTSTQAQDTLDKLLIAIEKHYVNQRKLLLTAIASKMPNLKVLVWKDRIRLERDFIEAIACSSAEHVKLEIRKIGKSCSKESSLSPPAQWKLPSAFINTLFRCCYSTLESLTWSHKALLKDGLGVTLDASNLAFQSLQLFSLFLRPSLTHLEMPTTSLDLTLAVPKLPPTLEKCMPIAEFIKRHKFVQNLQLGEDETSHIDGEEDPLSSLLVSILADGGFDHLRRLWLSWNDGMPSENLKVFDDDILETSLATLSKIDSLEQLSLSCFLTRCNWLVDHDKLRRQLQNLNRLKTLTLLGDTYYRSELSGQDVLPSQYYAKKYAIKSDLEEAEKRPHLDTAEDDEEVPTSELPEDDADEEDLELEPTEGNDDGEYGFTVSHMDAELGLQYMYEEEWGLFAFPLTRMPPWEKAHRNRMLAQAEAYAEALPALKVVYCGQWSMEFRPRQDEDGVVREEAFPIYQKRDEKGAHVSKIFKIEV